MTGGTPRKYRKLFQDSIVVEIPITDTKTADLGVAMKRTRAKRIASLYKHFPSLKKETPKQDNSIKEAQDDDDDQNNTEEKDNDDDDDKKPAAKKQKVIDETLPQREQYGSVVDYLEAKYVRGVMLGDEIDENEASDKESVYSEDSWLDDSLLKRDVAEQVLSHSTQTKVGVENDDEDDFFVNVGNLEVEEDELMNYDPAEEEKAVKKKTKKRKRSDAGSTAKSTKSGKSSAKTTPKKKSDSKSTSSTKEEASASGTTKDAPEGLEAIRNKTAELQAEVKELHDRIVSDIKAMSKEDLPERERNVQVTVSIPEGKNPGDSISFSNPHVPGQRLKVSIPKGKNPGDTFKVSIPAPQVESATDNNKFTREFQELVAHFATKYDEMCSAEAELHQADPDKKGKFPLKAKKIAKFDELSKEFPPNLLTPVDAAYMKKITRRARQNKKKRKEADNDNVAVASIAAKPAVASKPDAVTSKSKPAMKLDVKSMPKAAKHTLLKAVKPVKKSPEVAKKKATVEIFLPSKGRVFPTHELRHDEFEGMTKE